ncbi:AAA family ATPase [Lachnospiraceae bacterium 29-84]
MGVYLNSKSPYILFKEDANSIYFVDKSEILKEFVPILESEEGGLVRFREKGTKYICITRPRRFGKTVMANMIASYFGKGIDSSNIFGNLNVSGYGWYRKHLNQHNVIHIMLNELPRDCQTYQDYIERIQTRLLRDLMASYPDAGIEQEHAVWDVLGDIFEYCGGERFIFVLDEWDYIFHRNFVTEEEKASYIEFLRNLLKDKPYVKMVYMTGILPIAKYSSGSELNMFFEFSMASREKYSAYFGFTEEEVDHLYERYENVEQHPNVTRNGLRKWYDGYQTKSGICLYNPRSVIGALSLNQLGNYWTSSGPYDEIYTYVKHNIAGIKDEIASLISGGGIPANVEEYASTSMELATKDEIYSAMVVYGFLTYGNGYVSIPNKELADKFADMIRQKPAFGYINRLAAESSKMLEATKAGDAKKMAEILERVHNTESPLERYSSEAELSKVITFAYLQARVFYDIRLEDRSGTGYVDYIFYPYRKEDDGIIIELKMDQPVESAIQQIKDRNYALNFEGKLGEEPKCTGRILAVGIAYNRKDPNKRHTCKVEILRGKQVSL